TSLEQLASDVVEQDSGGQAVAEDLARLLAHAEAASTLSESDAGSEGFSLTLGDIEELLLAEAEYIENLVARADADTRESSESDPSPVTSRSTPSAATARARAAIDSLRAARTGEPPDSMLAAELAANDSAFAEAGSTESD